MWCIFQYYRAILSYYLRQQTSISPNTPTSHLDYKSLHCIGVKKADGWRVAGIHEILQKFATWTEPTTRNSILQVNIL